MDYSHLVFMVRHSIWLPDALGWRQFYKIWSSLVLPKGKSIFMTNKYRKKKWIQSTYSIPYSLWFVFGICLDADCYNWSPYYFGSRIHRVTWSAIWSESDHQQTQSIEVRLSITHSMTCNYVAVRWIIISSSINVVAWNTGSFFLLHIRHNTKD